MTGEETLSAHRPTEPDMKPAMNALQRLIRSRMAELNIDYVELAKRGGFPTHSTVYQLAHKANPKSVPRALTLERLAKALDLPLDLVRSAASDAAGFGLNDITTTLDVAEDVRIVVAGMQRLSAADRRKIRALLAALLEDMEEAAVG